LHPAGRSDDLAAHEQGRGLKGLTHQRQHGRTPLFRASRMAGELMELKAFFKYTCSSNQLVLPCRVSPCACTPITTTSQGLPCAQTVYIRARAAVALRP